MLEQDLQFGPGALRAILRATIDGASTVPAEQVPDLVAELERTKAVLLRVLWQGPPARAQTPAPDPADRLLTTEEAAKILGATPRWLYRHADELPFSRRHGRKFLRFSEAGIRRWMSRRSP